ncbi:peptidylprolyl isomerase [Cohnella pontilimi]|uniref:Peptidylprolyl isomerase n=1 Tax=Cohnella pontilimi TaxID=2564100 RepID=A0A4U0FIY6_9BACL|nr:peptidylprolyl isomerase [Cohnella pontilimi]TJY44434.1 peptidylprolyl isomerase [Cohnella pontilimi]
MNENDNKPVEPQNDAGLPENPINEATEGMRQAAAAAEAVELKSLRAEPERKFPLNWLWIGIALLALAALILVVVLNPKNTAMNEVLAKMDGATITKADLYDDLLKQMGAEQAGSRVDNLMALKLIDLEAQKVNAKVSDADIQGEIDNYKKGFPSEDEFNSALQQSNMTLDNLKEQIAIQVKLRKIFEPEIKPTEDQLKKYYEDNKADFGTAEKVRASHILLATKAEADAVLAELKKGADFATLAKQKSTDPGSKDDGGDLNYFGHGEMNEQFETAAFKLNVGEISGVVESPNGFHIIKLTDKKPAVTPSYDQVKEQVKNRYLDEHLQSLIGDWLDKQKKAYHYENLLAPASAPAPTAAASGQ